MIFKFKGTVEVEHDGKKMDVECYLYHDPGRTYGDPYDCYPEESECEIYAVTVGKRKLSVKQMDKLAEREDFISALFKAASEYIKDAEWDAAEERYDRQRSELN